MKPFTGKRAVLLLLVLTMALTAVTGGTIAWFTDTVTSSNNIIQSGNLDVKLEYLKDTVWLDVDDEDTPPLFNYQLWEPGYTQLRQLKLTNAGNLAFKFKLDILPEKAPEAGKANLADVIEVYVGEGEAPADLDAVETQGKLVGTISDLIGDENGAAYGVLLPKDGTGVVPEGVTYPEETIELWVALHMQEEAGNDYQNLSVGNGFALSLLATQFTYEEDAFDEQYDQAAPLLYPVSSAEELVATTAEGKSVVLTADITVNTGSIYTNSPDAQLTVDLAGHSIVFTGEGTGIGTSAGKINLTSTSDEPAKITLSDEAMLGAYFNDAVMNITNVDIVAGTDVEAKLQVAFGGTLNYYSGTISSNGVAPVCVYAGDADEDTTFNMYGGTLIVAKGTSSSINYGIAANNNSPKNSVVNLYGGKMSIGDYAVGIDAYKAKSVYIAKDFVIESGNTNSYIISYNKYGTQPTITGQQLDSSKVTMN